MMFLLSLFFAASRAQLVGTTTAVQYNTGINPIITVSIGGGVELPLAGQTPTWGAGYIPRWAIDIGAATINIKFTTQGPASYGLGNEFHFRSMAPKATCPDGTVVQVPITTATVISATGTPYTAAVLTTGLSTTATEVHSKFVFGTTCSILSYQIIFFLLTIMVSLQYRNKKYIQR
eukprot:g45105.t1